MAPLDFANVVNRFISPIWDLQLAWDVSDMIFFIAIAQLYPPPIPLIFNQRKLINGAVSDIINYSCTDSQISTIISRGVI